MKLVVVVVVVVTAQPRKLLDLNLSRLNLFEHLSFEAGLD